MTPEQALDRIAALCDKHDEWWAGLIGRDAAAFTVPHMRAILADVDPEPAPGWSEGEAAVRALRALDYVKSTDHVTGSVQWFPPEPAPASSTIDRDAALAAVDRVCRDDLSDYYGDVRKRMHDALLALVQPAQGSSTIDRVALREVLHVVEYNRDDIDWAIDRVLALVQPRPLC